MTLALGILLLLLAVLLRAGHEAVRASSRLRLRDLVDRAEPGNRAAHIYLDYPDYFRAAVSAQESACALAGATLLAAGAVERFGTVLTLSTLLLAALGFGALTALLSILARVPQTGLFTLLAPLVSVFIGVVAAVVPPTTTDDEPAGADGDSAESEREAVEEVLEEGVREGIVNTEDMKLVSGVVELRDTQVGEIMVPRAEIFALSADLAPDELARRIAASGYSRVPIYSGSLDSVAGIFHVLDVLKVGPHDLPPLRPVIAADRSERCSELLLRMLRQHAHMCIVTGERSQTVGLVTLEDLLEEIVGEIRDEFDEPAPSAASAVAGGTGE
jgi:CBS domain containing-hemolysin-like protein